MDPNAVRRAPSGRELPVLNSIYDRQGVNYTPRTVQCIATKVAVDSSDSDNLQLDNRSQYYFQGARTTLPSTPTATDLNLCASADSVGGDTTKLDITNIATVSQIVLFGVRVTLWADDGSGAFVDDIAFQLFIKSDGSYYLSDTKGTWHASTLTILGPDLGVSYVVNASGGTLTITATPPGNVFAQADVFIYERKTVSIAP